MVGACCETHEITIGVEIKKWAMIHRANRRLSSYHTDSRLYVRNLVPFVRRNVRLNLFGTAKKLAKADKELFLL